MIYLFVGTDRKKRALHVAKIVADRETISPGVISKELLQEYASSVSLFGEAPIVVIDGMLKENKTLFTVDMLSQLKDSSTTFIFLEDKLLAADEKKYVKYATVTHFEESKTQKFSPKPNTFAIADSFGRRDKVTTWVLYCEAIEQGVEPEAISGILFWKIKTLIQNGTKIFTLDDLRHRSGELVSLYHKAHRGECDFAVGLEQFILHSLSA